jgi:glycerophosphoryl diester phosphodiesterase
MLSLLDLALHPVIGHRGASGLAPENTLESFNLAVEHGADALEFDVRLSADGVPLVVHDPTLERTTDRTGTVDQLSAAEVQAADGGFRFTSDGGATHPWRSRGVRIPSVQEVLEGFPTIPLLIEIKVAAASWSLHRLLLEYGAANRVVVASFLDQALLPFHAEEGWATSASRKGTFRLWIRALFGLGAPRAPYRTYTIPEYYKDRVHVATRGLIRSARRAGRPVHVWTVNDPRRAARLWAWGVSGMITNYPALLLAERARHFPEEGGALNHPRR